MYYAIFDNQLGRIRSFGQNSQNLSDLKSSLIDYLLLGNFSDEGENSIKKNTLEEICNYYEFTLINSDDLIKDDFELREG
jgi:hypothetical protein